jgi:hypothetical protein
LLGSFKIRFNIIKSYRSPFVGHVRHRLWGPKGPHEMTGHAGGHTPSVRVGSVKVDKDVRRFDLQRRQATTANPGRPPLWELSRKTRQSSRRREHVACPFARQARAARPVGTHAARHTRARHRSASIIIYRASGAHVNGRNSTILGISFALSLSLTV